MFKEYDIIVVGAGHAGCEAAAAESIAVESEKIKESDRSLSWIEGFGIENLMWDGLLVLPYEL